MRWPTIVAVSIVLSLGIAVFAYAQLSSSQTASGTVTVSSSSANVYICEPGGVAGPACGADDNGADEEVFEGLENIRPGQTVEWAIRLKNTGTEDWIVTGFNLGIAETADPGSDCPDGALQPGGAFGSMYGTPVSLGVIILGKGAPAGTPSPTPTPFGQPGSDPVNDNPSGLFGVPLFQPAPSQYGVSGAPLHIKVAAGDYEDVKLRLQLAAFVASASPTGTPVLPSPTPAGTANCDGNLWDVSFDFTAS